MKEGEIIHLPHHPTLWERVKAVFGYQPPETKPFRVISDTPPNCAGRIVLIQSPEAATPGQIAEAALIERMHQA